MKRSNGTPSPHASSPQATSTLRPRPRRLISYDDEQTAVRGSDSDASPFASRVASPIPRTHPSRPSDAAKPPKALRDTSAALSGIWGSSWTAIQELATNVLGNEENGGAPADAGTRKRRPLLATHRRTSHSVPPKQWGPSAPAGTRVGMGSQEERDSQVRAMKREALLTANAGLASDAAGRVKRRNSDDRGSHAAPPAENEDHDALVYIHRVRPEDTLAGVTIRFNCSPAVLRKANRMWPNDSIQTKRTVVLPVDACGVKGRPVAGPDGREEDLLLGDYSGLPSEAVDTSLAPTVSRSSAELESPWKHHSWVLLPNDTKPVEIGRMPRRTLGFFPPARRKSVAFSDTSTASLDLPRSSASADHFSPHSSAPQTTADKRRPSSNRTSSVSNSRGRARSGSNSFVLHGPGGVGTLGKNIRSPGPGQDPLNKLLAPHLPNLEPPPDQEYFTPWAPALLDGDAGTYTPRGGSGARTPLGGVDFQEIGGAIEGWMRNVGAKASKLLSEPSTPGRANRGGVPALGSGRGDLGDLIELRDDAFEIGDNDEPRGRPSPTARVPSTTQQSTARPDFVLSMRDRGRRGAEGRKTD